MFAYSTGSDIRAVAQAMCMEHQILDHVKSALRVTLEWRAPTIGLPRKMSSVQFTTQSFMRHLRRMIELEEQDGYMAIVLEQKPHLEHRVAKLRRQHAQFRECLEELAPAVAAITALPEPEFERVCRQIVGMLDRVDQHDFDEIELLQESMLCEEGGEG
jgi:hypothetical protein